MSTSLTDAPVIAITGRRVAAGREWPAAIRGEPLDVHVAAYARAVARAGPGAAIDQPGAGMTITATALDGTAEAIESGDGKVPGVQWHPELHHDHDAVSGWLVSQATAALSTAQLRG